MVFMSHLPFIQFEYIRYYRRELVVSQGHVAESVVESIPSLEDGDRLLTWFSLYSAVG